jgi:SAM-dependent methyltransferase
MYTIPVASLDADGLSPHGCLAIQIEIADPELQAYLQRYPFAEGPKREMNERGKKAIAAGIRFRAAGPKITPAMLSEEQARLTTGEQGRVNELLDRIGMSAMQKQVQVNDFGWEANLVPRETKSVLVVGCGDGIELIFLRAVLPEARITAIDYRNSLLPGLAEAVGLTFFEGDIGKHLPTLSREYDLAFSNHTMEHLYAPDQMLAILANLLVAGGYILSTMPMVGLEGTPFLEEVLRFTTRRATDATAEIHPLELVYFDAGHPWKTNPGDLAATVKRAGFTDVRIFQRENHRSRPLQLTPRQFRRRRGFMVCLNRLFVSPVRRVTMSLFPRKVPRQLPKLFFAVERRLPFGTNYIVNLFSEEALFLARVDR